MIAIEYHDDLNEVQADGVLAELLSAPSATAPFDRLEWWRALEAECGLMPFIAIAKDGENRAILPMYHIQRRLEAFANWYNFRVGPLFSSGADPAALLTALARDLTGEAPRIVLSPLPDESGETTAIVAAFRRAGWLVFRSVCDTNHILRVDGRSFAEYLAARPGALRTALRRKADKVAISIETHYNPDSWQAYEAIYAKSWKPQEGSPSFLRRFAAAEGAAGRLRLGIARCDGEPVAAQLWSVEGGTAFIHKLAHTEGFRQLSPGTTLSAALFEHVIDRDQVSLVDFGTGDDPYKRDWMDEVRPRYRLDILRPGWPGNWPAIARHTARRLADRFTDG